MAKATIYLPDDLDKAVRAAEISLSPICQAALEQEVKRVNATVNASQHARRVAERLKATATGRSGKAAEGFALGVRWAQEVATLAELEHMVKIYDLPGVHLQLHGEHTLPRFLASQPGYEGYARPPATEEPQATDWRFERDPWLDGLIGGAYEVYTQVLPYL